MNSLTDIFHYLRAISLASITISVRYFLGKTPFSQGKNTAKLRIFVKTPGLETLGNMGKTRMRNIQCIPKLISTWYALHYCTYF